MSSNKISANKDKVNHQLYDEHLEVMKQFKLVNAYVKKRRTNHTELYIKEINYFNNLYTKGFMDYPVFGKDFSSQPYNSSLSISLATINQELSRVLTAFGKAAVRHGK